MNVASPRFFSIIILLAAAVSGRSQSSLSISDLQKKQNVLFSEQSNRVRTYATRNSIPILRNTLEGRQLLLVDVHNGIPVYVAALNSGAALTTGASALHSGIAGVTLEGEGMLIGVWYEGSVKAHIELGSRVLTKEVNNPQTHSTHVTGTLIAAGVNASAKGMAPKGQVTNWFFDNDLAEMAALAKPDEASLLLSNHSYGTVTGWTKINNVWNWTGDPSVSSDEDYKFGLYGSKAAALDELTNLAPYYTIVWAAGNDRGEPGDGAHPPDCNGGSGFDCIIPEGTAKNIITVGAVNKVASYSGPTDVVMSNFSSWGPTDDGRIKPDLVGAGVSLLSLSATGTDGYSTSSGTSMATPNVTGSLALLQELYSKLHSGHVMKSATLKALAIHTTKEAGSLPGPDYRFGWGLLDVQAGAKLVLEEDGLQTMIKEEVLNEGEEFEIMLTPKANQKITATVVWTDPVGTLPQAALDPTNLMLVNDLDVKLIAQNGATQYPWLLDPANPSAQAIKGDNFRDNVEKLEFSFPLAISYRLVVNHKGALKNGSQPFSLILTYQSIEAGSTLYWIGDSGNWNDNSHWSLTSGGPPAFITPTSKDVVVVDDNSFDGIGENKISLQQNQSVRVLKWISKYNSTLDLQSNALTVSKNLSIATPSFRAVGTGTINLVSQLLISGSAYFSNNDFEDVRLTTNGNWSLSGDVAIGELELVAGTLSISNSILDINSLKANGATAKELNLVNTTMKLHASSEISGSSLSWSNTESKIAIENGNVSLNWNGVDFTGKLEVKAAGLDIIGSNTFEEISIFQGSNIQLDNGANQNIGNIGVVESTEENPVSISSAGKSTITLRDHFLICTDFLTVTNTDLMGSAVINGGVNSTIVNSENWKAQSCASVLFADFNEKFLCQNGLTEFYDNSKGSVSSWQWDFGDEGTTFTESDLQNPFHSFENTGTFPVSLTVSDGNTTHTYSKVVDVQATTFARNKIAVNASSLTSVDIAPDYQWFVNGEKIPEATLRSYAFDGDEGVYQVVIGAGECNRTSELVTITGLDESSRSFSIYPNPADQWITIESTGRVKQLAIHDAMGRLVLSKISQFEIPVGTTQLDNGLYLVKIVTQDGVKTQRILIKHQ